MANVIAEIGCNHKGEMDTAKKLITVAATYCGADVAKFQKRNNKELLTEEQYNTPHPVPEIPMARHMACTEKPLNSRRNSTRS